ncbi:MAG: hypothetical protein RR500_07720 [Bacilli bacterium]
MGTSKGYIPPTRPEWTKAKRAVTGLLNDKGGNSVANVSSTFATAMKSEIKSNSTFSQATANIFSFIQIVKNEGAENALISIGYESLISKSTNEIWDTLLHEYTNDGSTVEESLVLDALTQALENLGIESLENIIEISQDALLKEMLIEYISISFEFRFFEKISRDRSPKQANQIIEEIRTFIRNDLYEQLYVSDMSTIDFSSISGSEYIEKSLIDAYSVFERYYEER